MVRPPVLSAALVAVALALVATHAATSQDPAALLPGLVREFTEDEADLEAWLSVPRSPQRRARLDTLADDWEARLARLDHAALGVDDRVDRLLLLAHLRGGRAERAREAGRAERLATALPFAAPIRTLEESRWTLTPVDPAAVAGEIDDWAQAVEAVSATPPEVSAADALWLARELDGLRETLGTWREHHGPFDPGFAWWTDAPAQRLDDALVACAKTLRETRAKVTGAPADPLVGDPIGRPALVEALTAAWLADTPEDLITLGEAQLAWCEEQLAEQAAALGHGGDWRAALEQVKRLHVAPGEQDDLVLAIAQEAVAFLDEHELVTIPSLCRETFRVRMLSPEAQANLPFAAYDDQHMLVAFPAATMAHGAKLQAMRGNNRAFTRAITPHELIPGHHLQGFMAERHQDHRRLFATPFLGEGWALHWEFLFYEGGFARTPEERIGMLFWRAHRAARVVFSLRFHLGEITAEEAVELLVARVGHERDNARAEVRRAVGGDYSPLYQCAYLLGALQIQALHGELVTGGAMTARAFHDGILESGPIPVEFLRAILTGTRLPADHRPSWRLVGQAAGR